MSTLVLFDLDENGVATLTLNRPERNNAWTPDLEREYFGCLADADADPAVRVIVVTGAGKSFCPGVDSGRLESLVGNEFDIDGRISPTSPLGIRKPLIAAINGACAGMGLVQALMCDIRFMSRSARIATSFARRGLAAEYGIAYLLPRLIGQERALDLLLSGRTVGADEARDLGVVSRVTEPEDLLPAALAYATELATKSSPLAMAFAKHQVWTALDQDLTEAMRSAFRSMRAAVEGADFREGLESFMEKRDPAFSGLAAEVTPSDVTGVTIDTAFLTLGPIGFPDETR